MKPGPPNILVIEDDPDIRENLKLLLELEGYDVSTARHGREGLERLSRAPLPKLILLDLMMPVMNGWEFLRAWRARKGTAGIPVLVVSAAGEQAREVSAAGVLFKPFDASELMNAVRTFVG